MNQADPLQRLRDADPARDLHPSPDFVASVLARRDAAGDGASDEHDGAAPVSESDLAPVRDLAPVSDLAAARYRRRSGWVRGLVAAAAAAVVFGGGGYVAGLSTVSSSGSSLFSGSDSAAADQADEAVAVEESAESADMGANDMGDSGADAVTDGQVGAFDRFGAVQVEPAAGAVVFVGSDFATRTGTAAGYGLDVAAAQAPTRLQLIADALGLSGEFAVSEGMWELGGSASGPTLRVDVGTGHLSYFDFTNDPLTACDGADAEACLDDAAANRPTESDARQRLSDFLASIDLEPATFEFLPVATSVTSDYEATAMAAMVVDGVATDLIWTLTLTASGVTWVEGPLEDVVYLADYPVVSEQEAFERLSDPTFGAVRVTYPSGYLPDHAERAGQVPSAPEPGGEVEWDVPAVTVTSDGLGLAALSQADGGTRLVPVYRFVAEDGASYQVLAPTDDVLDFTAD